MKQRFDVLASLPGAEQVIVRPDDQPAPVSVVKKSALQGEPIITSDTKVTIAKVSRDGRYYVDPASVRPVFGAMVPGRYWSEAELGVCDAA